ncbi:MAG: efflux RND transporter periplasmic adaptor subunit [Candidatus Cryptobacteroides sp.]
MAAFAAVSCRTESNSGEESVILVKTETAKSFSASTAGEYPFISKPFRTSVLSFKVGGTIDRLEIYPGNHYRRGDIIAEIQTRDFRIRKERAQAVYDQMKAEFERVAVLFEKGNVPASAYEKAKADCITSKMAYEEACNALEDTRLVAPFDGYASEVFIDNYQDIKPSEPVVSLIDISKLKIEIYVTQEVAMSAGAFGSVDIVFDALGGETFKAKVVETSMGTGRNNLSYTMTALLPNPDGRLLSGMSGKAMLNPEGTSCVRSGVVVPSSALCHRPQTGDFVWVVDRNTLSVSMRKVSGSELLPGGDVLIRDGLAEGETVATTGLRFLCEGMNVRINGGLS